MRLILFTTCLGVIFSICGSAQAQSEPVSPAPTATTVNTSPIYRAMYTSLTAQHDHGFYDGAEIELPQKTFSLVFGTHQLVRQYSPSPRLQDQSYDLGYNQKLGGGRYLETGASWAPHADILPVTMFTATPHQTFGANDLSLGLQWRNSPGLQSGSVSPLYAHDFKTGWRTWAGFSYLRTYDHLFAERAGFGRNFCHEKLPFRFDLAGGKTLEDAHLEATFQSYSTELGWKARRFSYFGSLGHYESNHRNENSVGLRVEFR